VSPPQGCDFRRTTTSSR